MLVFGNSLYYKALHNARLCFVVAFTCAVICFGSQTIQAQPLEPPQPQYGWRQMWSGADAIHDVWLLYSGVTLAPWSADIHSDGIRLRASGGYGEYSYTAQSLVTTDCGAPARDACQFKKQRFNVAHTYIEALVGYQKRYGELTAKAFVGIAGISHTFDKQDLGNETSGDSYGVKGTLELWLNLWSTAWTSLDLSHATAHDTSAARWRAGWRVLPTLSIGPELRYDSNSSLDKNLAEQYAARAGGFVRYEWNGGEISLASGVSERVVDSEQQGQDVYGTANVLIQF